MIIGISGKIGSGKDTVGAMLQHLLSNSSKPLDTYLGYDTSTRNTYSGWIIKKFAGKVKEICSILTGIPVEEFEKEEVKNKYLPDEWNRYEFDRFIDSHLSVKYIDTIQRSDRYQFNRMTVRDLLQQVGTDAMRTVIHPDVWVNALFSEYRVVDKELRQSMGNTIDYEKCFPKWIITDVRFLNEATAIKKRGGFIIRVNRDISKISNHISETALDDYRFDHVIDNNHSLDTLYDSVKFIVEELTSGNYG